MKIVIFDINRLSFEGGAEKYLSEVGKTFNEKGDEVCFVGDCRPIMGLFIWGGVFLLVNPPWKLPQLFLDLKKVSPLNKDSQKYISFFPLKLWSLIPLFSERKKVRQILNQADMILIKNEFFEVLFFWLLNIKNKKRYAVVFSSLRYPFSESFRAKIHNLVYLGKLYNFLVKKIGKVIVSNREDEKYIAEKVKIEPMNIFYVPYGLAKSYFVKPRELKNTTGFKILFVGRMEEQKGIFYLKQLIESVNKTEFKQPCKSISFSLVGSGPLEEIPRKLAEKYDNVEYKGQLPPAEVRQCYLRSDLVIITSKWETFSYVCLEAQACGVPVVTFDIPGPQDIISQGTGSLVSLGNISEMRDKIYFYLNNKIKNSPEDYLKIRIKISKLTSEKFGLEKTVEKLRNLV